MDPKPVEDAIKELNNRLDRVEQILPTLATQTQVRDESEQTRRHTDAGADRLERTLRSIAQEQASLVQRFDQLRLELKMDIARLDRRVVRLEIDRSPAAIRFETGRRRR